MVPLREDCRRVTVVGGWAVLDGARHQRRRRACVARWAAHLFDAVDGAIDVVAEGRRQDVGEGGAVVQVTATLVVGNVATDADRAASVNVDTGATLRQGSVGCWVLAMLRNVGNPMWVHGLSKGGKRTEEAVLPWMLQELKLTSPPST